MSTKPLNDEQKRDAARLKAAFKLWQSTRKELGLPHTQDEVSEGSFGYKQSAFSQYLNGTIPLNAKALLTICAGLEVVPASISPRIVREMDALAHALNRAGPAVTNVTQLPTQAERRGNQQVSTEDGLRAALDPTHRRRQSDNDDVQTGARPHKPRHGGGS